MIPKSFKIAGGKVITVNIIHSFDEPGKFGDFIVATNTIELAKFVKDEDIEWALTEEDIERTFYHELFHVFQWYYDTDLSEVQAQVYSNFLYEYAKTKQIS